MTQIQTNKPGYKQTPLGWIPEDWEVATVGDAYTISNNLRFPISEEIRKTIKGNYPYYGPTKIQDFINEYRVEGKYALIGEDGDHFLKWRELPMTLLIEGKFNVNNHAHLIKGEKNLIEWFFYFFNHRELTPYLTRQGAGRYKLTKESLVKIPISIPPFSEQQKIATILSTWDAGIAKEQQLIDALQTRHRALMRQLLSGKKRLKGFKEEWKFIRFNEIYRSKKQTAGNRRILSLSVTKEGIVSQQEYFNKEITSEDTSNYLIVQKGDMVMSGLNFWMGSIDTLTKYDEGIVSPAYKVFEIFNSSISPIFMRYFVRSSIMLQALIGSSVVGASIVRRNMDRETLEEWSFHLPPLPEQSAIANILSTSEKEIQTHRRRLAALQQQKKGLMQVLLTGKVRVNLKK